MDKLGIIHELGEDELLLPSLVNAGLDANERAKYFLTLLQTARSHADHPDTPADDLRSERLAAGVQNSLFDRSVQGARPRGEGTYVIPESEPIIEGIVQAIENMLVPVQHVPHRAANLVHRLAALRPAMPTGDTAVPGRWIDEMTSAQRERGDSLHLLVMDLHKELNRLQSEFASENLAGASVYGLRPEDRAQVEAFMRGVGATERLKFDHPGLGTTATRIGERLVIQNDIGTTDAHVLVIQIEGLVATVVHTDVHPERLRFFQRRLAPFEVTWSEPVARGRDSEAASYELFTGRFAAPNETELGKFLELLGSQLVFLIDWNRARKQLRELVGKRQALKMLDWAANERCGHMAFLRIGGTQALYQAIELASSNSPRYGQPLRDLLGPQVTEQIVRFALQVAAQRLLSGTSEQLVRDEIRAEVGRHLRTVEMSLLDVVAQHASLIVETAMAVSEAILRGPACDGGDFAMRTAARARRWEHQADGLVNQVRRVAHRVRGTERFEQLIISCDDAIDDLEEAAFLLTLLVTQQSSSESYAALGPLATHAVSAAQEQLRALEIARQRPRLNSTDDLSELLQIVDQVMADEHAADDAHRAARTALLASAPDFKQLEIALEVARSIEDSTDSMMRSALLLRDYTLTAGAPL